MTTEADGSPQYGALLRVRRSLLLFSQSTGRRDADLTVDVLKMTTVWLASASHDEPEAWLGEVLSSVIAKSSEELEIWRRSWLLSADVPSAATSRVGRHSGAGAEAGLDRKSPATVQRKGAGREMVRAAATILKRRLLSPGTVIGLAIICTILGGLYLYERFGWRPWTDLERPALLVGASVLVAAAALGAIAVLVSLLRVQSPLLSALSNGFFEGGGSHTASLWSETFKTVAKDLRRLGALQRPTNRARLDIARTVASSVDQMGLFTPVYRPVFESPHYLFIVALEDERSHVLGEAARLADSFARTGLASEVLFWRPVTGALLPERSVSDLQSKPRQLDYADLWARHPDATLVIIANPRSLIDPITLRPRGHLQALTNWDNRILLSPKPALDDLERQATAQLGLRTGRLSFEDFPGMMETIGRLPGKTQRPQKPPLMLQPRLLKRWDLKDQGDTEWSLLREALAAWLGDAGMDWLIATAVLPYLQWEVTLAIGQTLKGPDGESLYSEARLARLLGLVWFEDGALSHSVRRRLLAHVDSQQRSEILTTLEALTRVSHGAGGAEASGGRVRGRPASALDASLRPSLDDRLTQSFFRNAPSRWRSIAELLQYLGLSSPRTNAKAAQRRPRRPPRPVISRPPDEDWADAVQGIGSLSSEAFYSLVAAFGLGPGRRHADAFLALRTFLFKGAGTSPDEPARSMRSHYEDLTGSKHITEPAISEAVTLLDEIGGRIRSARQRRAVYGAYIWGGASWGKSALLQAFVASKPTPNLALLNFKSLMAAISELLIIESQMARSRRSVAYLHVRLRTIARWVAREITLLCIDDVTPVPPAEADFFRVFLQALDGENVCLILTSRYPPEQLAPPSRARGELSRLIDKVTIVKAMSPETGAEALQERGEHMILRDIRRHQQVYEDSGRATAVGYVELAKVRAQEGEFNQAEALLRRAITAREKTLDRARFLPHWFLDLGLALEAQGRVHDAAEIFERGRTEIEGQYDPSGSLERELLSRAAEMNVRIGNLQKAYAQIAMAIDAEKVKAGVFFRDTATNERLEIVAENLASRFDAQDQQERATNLRRLIQNLLTRS